MNRVAGMCNSRSQLHPTALSFQRIDEQRAGMCNSRSQLHPSALFPED
jgi:hypothetical protein